MSLRDIFLRKQEKAAKAAEADHYARAAAELGKKLDAFVPHIHDVLEDYFSRLDAGRAPGWLLRRRMESLVTLRNVEADAFTPAALEMVEGYHWLQDVCSGSDIDTAIMCRFHQNGKNVLACFRLLPEKPFAESRFEISTDAGKRTFHVETGKEILPEGAILPPASPVETPVETDSSITVTKPLTLKNKPPFS